MKQLRPRWSGPLNCPIEQGFFGVSKVEAPAREDHLEGVARWAPFHRRRRVGWRGAGVARGRGTVGRGGRQARPDGGVVGGSGEDARAARRGRTPARRGGAWGGGPPPAALPCPPAPPGRARD